MKDLTKLTAAQRDNLTAGTWWDPAVSGAKGNGATKPVEIVGEVVPDQITAALIVPVRRNEKGKTFPITVERLIAKYTPRAVVVEKIEPAPEPQMTLPLDAPPWALGIIRDLAFLVKEAKSRGAITP